MAIKNKTLFDSVNKINELDINNLEVNKLNPKKEKKIAVTFKIDKEDYEAFRAYAKKIKMSYAMAIRQAIYSYIKEDEAFNG